ncbi:hypothetical protein Acsp04_43140 [Actinomadura sp. NBRC 104425]|uniref:substrate-binding domain-containing protein n=1 Tax=Actinomadura sp. NBRC 104425 TaxID=3032204 RepID=UPI0024A3FDC6|nr:substrate-binding domain-containing protein [Actinomadura sp. NBRC 104425]GLZ14079.1 hypothetical protein Acsp04_43140 [Actinomadura sp. NBRC 104425]
MSGRHRVRGMGGRRRRAVVAVSAGAAVLAAAVAYGVVRVRGCGGPDALTLDVAAAPEIAPAVRSVAARFGAERHAVGGRCVRARVRAVESYAMSAALAGNAPLDGGLRRPDVWIPDTSAWAHLAGASSGAVVTRTSVATTPLVAVLPGRPAGGAPPSWHDLLGTRDDKPTRRIAVPDPARDGAGIAALLLTPVAGARHAAAGRGVRQRRAGHAAEPHPGRAHDGVGRRGADHRAGGVTCRRAGGGRASE